MKKLFFTKTYYIPLIIACLACTSCKKSADPNSFVWTFKGKSYSADWSNAYLSSRASTPIIVGGIGPNVQSSVKAGISLSSFNTGTYTFGAGSNTFYYVDDNGTPLTTISGSAIITVNQNSRLSGTFNATLADLSGVQNVVSGSFTNVMVSQ